MSSAFPFLPATPSLNPSAVWRGSPVCARARLSSAARQAGRADEPLDATLLEGRLLREHDPGIAVDRERIADLGRQMLAVANAVVPVRLLHHDFVDSASLIGGAGLGKPRLPPTISS
jgi:hypothetical protein